MQRADLTNACNLKNLKRADAERAVDKAKERLAKVFGIKVVTTICRISARGQLISKDGVIIISYHTMP